MVIPTRTNEAGVPMPDSECRSKRILTRPAFWWWLGLACFGIELIISLRGENWPPLLIFGVIITPEGLVITLMVLAILCLLRSLWCRLRATEKPEVRGLRSRWDKVYVVLAGVTSVPVVLLSVLLSFVPCLLIIMVDWHVLSPKSPGGCQIAVLTDWGVDSWSSGSVVTIHGIG
jgi:hypothetical protein